MGYIKLVLRSICSLGFTVLTNDFCYLHPKMNGGLHSGEFQRGDCMYSIYHANPLTIIITTTFRY